MSERKSMKQFDYVIRDKLGLHARAAAKLAQYAQTSACDIYIQKDRKIVDMKNVMGLISLKSLKNDKVSVFVNGEREEEVVEDMKRYMGENL